MFANRLTAPARGRCLEIDPFHALRAQNPAHAHPGARCGLRRLELTTLLSEEFGDDLDLVLVDKREGFVFGFSKLDVMFGRTPETNALHRYFDLVKPGVRFMQSTVRAIDPHAKRVVTDPGVFDADILVVALGADLRPDATPGLVEGGHQFYTEAGAFALRDVLAGFQGGRVIVGVTSTPFKCPPAPSERGIHWRPERLVRALDPTRKVAMLGDGGELPYDLFLGIPVHVVPEVVFLDDGVRRPWRLLRGVRARHGREG